MAIRGIKGGLAGCPPHGSRTPAAAPLIDAENLFRQRLTSAPPEDGFNNQKRAESNLFNFRLPSSRESFGR